MRFVVLAIALFVASCGHTQSCRIGTTALLGSVAFPVGTVAGAAIGGATTDQQVYLGESWFCQ